jgi:hypothetical protein
MIFRRLAALVVFLAMGAALGGLVWAATDTPENEPSGDQKPIISDVDIDIDDCPFSTLTATAHITDDGQSVSATLWYRRMYSPRPTFASTQMLDDGFHGDGVPGDDVYGAVVQFLPATRDIEAYLQAVDDVGQASRFPPPPFTTVWIHCFLPQPELNEFMAVNETTLEDPDEPGEFPAWIELYSEIPFPQDIGGFCLTDDLSDPTKFRITDGVTVSARNLLLFWADGEPEQGPFHTNFVLNPEGGEIGIFRKDGTGPVSVVTYTAQLADVSFARKPDGWGSWDFSACPSPGMLNRCRLYLPLVAKE